MLNVWYIFTYIGQHACDDTCKNEFNEQRTNSDI